MKIDLHGGFGEKGRASVGVRAAGKRILLDAGIKVGAADHGYHPAIGDDDIAALDALFVSHAHEDHIGGLPWLMARGFRGRIFMTQETMTDGPATLAAYANAEDLARAPFPRQDIELFAPGDEIALGDLRISSGRSGHVVGGVWFSVADGEKNFVYSADVTPESGVFAMDALPACDLLAVDASYGGDPVSGAERAEAIARWILDHPGGCLLPTPLHGRSLELIAAISEPIAICAGMRDALEAQIAASHALKPDVARMLSDRLTRADDWRDGDPLPRRPLLCDDGMGQAGPSAALIPLADAQSYPVLLTGHLPNGSPAHRLRERGRADWIRMPTHPTLAGLIDIWRDAGEPTTLGHSCEADDLNELSKSLPALRPSYRTGQSLTV